MRCAVVGAGAWGLPAAAELAARGHEVVLLDRHGVGNALSSSPGPTRLWRLTHPDALRVRLGLRSVEAMERLQRRSGREVLLRRGLLWRDGARLEQVIAALAAEGVEHEVVEAGDVGRHVPGLRPDGRRAVWQPEAGPVLAAASLEAQAALLQRDGGRLEVGRAVREVEATPAGVRLACEDGGSVEADVAVLAPGPGAGPLLAGLGVELELRPHLEQVVHLGDPAHPAATDGFPCLVDTATDERPGIYAMPTPGRGYKIGIDVALRPLAPGDDDRTPDERLIAASEERVRLDLPSVVPHALDAQVCSWTMPPDGRFVVDRLPGGVVIACGDGGEGFKFSALMGLVLADLAEGGTPDADVATFALAGRPTRFGDAGSARA